MQLRKDSCLEGLTQLQPHLAGLPVPMRPPLALAGAEGGRAVLTVDQGPVWEGSGPGAPDLRGKGLMSQARASQLTLRLPPAQVPNLGLPRISLQRPNKCNYLTSKTEATRTISKPPFPPSGS